MENVFENKANWNIIQAGTNNITNGINSLNLVKKIVTNIEKTPKHKTFFLQYIT